MSVHDEVVNYNGGEFHNTDTIYLFDDWTNNAGNEAFISLGIGIVHLYGSDQRIKGSDITRFYDLRLEQTGIKYGDLDVYVDGFLRLNDRRFHMDTNCVHVFNPQLIAVENIGKGYVSALGNGGLLRQLQNTQTYFYPVGWPNYYRPLELTMSAANLNQMKVRMAFADATNEGFDRDLREPTLCEVNPTFYHQIHQITGNDAAQIKIHYDENIDGAWNTIAHFQNVPQWEDTGLETSGIDPITNLNFYQSIDFISDFTYPAFALGDSSDSLLLTASDTVICEGETVIFTGETGYNFYEFFVNGVSVQTGSNHTYTDSNLQNGDVIHFTAVADECIYFGTSVVMTVHPLPIAIASSNSPVCEHGILELSALGGTSYNWSGPANFTSSEQNPIINDVSLIHAGTYIVTVTDQNGCMDETTIEVVIFPEPEIAMTSNSPICDGDDIILTATGGVSYEWTGAGGFISSEQNPIIQGATLIHNGNYTVTITDNNGCTHSSTLNVVVHTLPNAVATNDSPVCIGNDIQLTAAGGLNYEWSGVGGFTSSEQNPILENVTLDVAGTYTVTVTDGNTCVATATTEVTIFPPVEESASNDSPTCIGETVQINATGDPSWSYQWFGPSNFSETIQNPSINNAQLENSGTYLVFITDNNACTASYTTVVLVSDYPELNTTENTPLCEGEDVFLETTYDPTWDYIWEGPLGFLDSVYNPTIEEVYIENEGEYIVTAINGSGCSTTDTVMVEIYEGVMANIYGDTTIFETTSTPIGVIDNGGYTYQWTPSETLSCNDCPNPIATPLISTTYQVVVTNGDGCSTTLSVTVNVKERTDEDLIVPNTITPNGDGYNDTWVIPWIDRFSESQVVILNRWGDEVFSASPYENDFNGNFEGRPLPAGTYYYILLLGEDFTTFKGPLTILRE